MSDFSLPKISKLFSTPETKRGYCNAKSTCPGIESPTLTSSYREWTIKIAGCYSMLTCWCLSHLSSNAILLYSIWYVFNCFHMIEQHLTNCWITRFEQIPRDSNGFRYCNFKDSKCFAKSAHMSSSWRQQDLPRLHAFTPAMHDV